MECFIHQCHFLEPLPILFGSLKRVSVCCTTTGHDYTYRSLQLVLASFIVRMPTCLPPYPPPLLFVFSSFFLPLPPPPLQFRRTVAGKKKSIWCNNCARCMTHAVWSAPYNYSQARQSKRRGARDHSPLWQSLGGRREAAKRGRGRVKGGGLGWEVTRHPALLLSDRLNPFAAGALYCRF